MKTLETYPSNIHRLRRNRLKSSIRKMVAETQLKASDLVVPLFLVEGERKRVPIPSMPGINKLSLDFALEEIKRLVELGIESVLLFPSIDSRLKTFNGEKALNANNLLYLAIYEVKKRFPEICLMADVALDPYTSHGHDGLLDSSGKILNDESVEVLSEMAFMQAKAGIDFVAPSDMLDGRVFAIRKKLDAMNFSHVGILSYSAKYASNLYGPFRDALNVSLQYGDKKSYQLNFANVREALLEAKVDEEEGADILMVKPALFYLDVIAKLRQQTLKPIAAYHVSGEYSMVMAAQKQGFLDAKKVFFEALTSIKRAGSDLIFTYAADFVLDLL